MIRSTKDVLNAAMQNCDYSFDIYFRMAVIDKYLNNPDDDIWILYNEMQFKRCNDLKYIPENMVDHKNEFIHLIDSIKNDGYDRSCPIITNQDGLILDGAHRLACALYFDIKKVSVKIDKDYFSFIPRIYSREWFIEYELEECIKLGEEQKELLKKRGY